MQGQHSTPKTVLVRARPSSARRVNPCVPGTPVAAWWRSVSCGVCGVPPNAASQQPASHPSTISSDGCLRMPAMVVRVGASASSRTGGALWPARFASSASLHSLLPAPSWPAGCPGRLATRRRPCDLLLRAHPLCETSDFARSTPSIPTLSILPRGNRLEFPPGRGGRGLGCENQEGGV